MPHFVVEKVQSALNGAAKPVKGSRIHILGVAYKKDISDVRESPALDIMLLLRKRGGVLSFSDSNVHELKLDGETLRNTALDEGLSAADCVVIVTDHSSVDYKAVLDRSRLIVDTRNALKGMVSDKIVRL
jgi:UDP-N-acetyl-D-glucosamine dehydrogenase